MKIKPPKSKASIRTINLTNQAITALQEQQEYLHSQGQGTCQIVFPNEVGGYLRRGSFTRWSWSPLLTAADIDHRGFHHLRHTAATLMLNAGVPIQVVSRILGHASPAVTLKIYAHVLPGLEIQAADKISQLLD